MPDMETYRGNGDLGYLDMSPYRATEWNAT
jgi:hypothetical protein